MKLAALVPALFVLVSLCGSPVPPPPGSVSGTVFFDANHNAIHDKCDDDMSGAPVLLTTADGKTTRADADTNGAFLVQGVAPGDVTFSLDAGPTNWAWPITTKPDNSSGTTIHVESNKETSGVEIGSASRAAFPTDSVSVIGLVFIDTNQNGVVDKDECGKRVPANVYGDSQYVSVGTKPFTGVGRDGSFEVRNIAAGTSESALRVRYILGQFPTTPDLQGNHPCYQYTTPKPRYAANIYEAIVPYNARSQRASLSGTVFEDQNRNGQRDPGESGVPNQVVYLNPQGITCGGDQKTISGNETTDGTGAFIMGNVPLGVYTIQVENSWPSDNPYPATITIPGFAPEMTVTLRAGDLNVLDLPVRVEQSSAISVFVFDDANNNGAQDSGEDPVYNYSVCAFRSPNDPNYNNPYDYHGQTCGPTDHSGIALLGPLGSGEYDVPAQQFSPDYTSVPLREQPPSQQVTLAEGDQASVSIPLQVVSIAEQVIAPGAGNPVEFETCYSDPAFIQPDFDEHFATAFPYGAPPEDEARSTYDKHIYASEGSLTIWSWISGHPYVPLFPDCLKPNAGQLFVFVDYEPVSVVSAGGPTATPNFWPIPQSVDSVLQIVLRRIPGLHAIVLPSLGQTSPFPFWQIFVDENYNPIDRMPGNGGYPYPAGVSGG